MLKTIYSVMRSVDGWPFCEDFWTFDKAEAVRNAQSEKEGLQPSTLHRTTFEIYAYSVECKEGETFSDLLARDAWFSPIGDTPIAII